MITSLWLSASDHSWVLCWTSDLRRNLRPPTSGEISNLRPPAKSQTSGQISDLRPPEAWRSVYLTVNIEHIFLALRPLASEKFSDLRPPGPRKIFRSPEKSETSDLRRSELQGPIYASDPLIGTRVILLIVQCKKRLSNRKPVDILAKNAIRPNAWVFN